ncbi:hypothetical protein [Shinella zoogloeoides]
MSKSNARFSNLEELSEVLEQRKRLEAVLVFLEEHDACDELMDAIDEALGDLDVWIDEELLVQSHPLPRLTPRKS